MRSPFHREKGKSRIVKLVAAVATVLTGTGLSAYFWSPRELTPDAITVSEIQASGHEIAGGKTTYRATGRGGELLGTLDIVYGEIPMQVWSIVIPGRRDPSGNPISVTGFSDPDGLFQDSRPNAAAATARLRKLVISQRNIFSERPAGT